MTTSFESSIQKQLRSFGSDNHAGVHPEILRALSECNVGQVPSYGTDPWSFEAERVVQSLFASKNTPRPQVFFVFNGTAANVTSMVAMSSPYHSILTSDVSHLWRDECGAPEFFTGSKLIPVPANQNAQLDIEELDKKIERLGDQHHSQPRVLSLTQPTELGTTYSLSELAKLTRWAKSKGLLVHIDGARIANAAAHLGVSFRELITEMGVDVLSFGGTKNGLMMGEMVIFLKPKLGENFKYIRKQSCQLPSKSRFIAAQFLAYFKNDLWLQIAQHSLQMALRLYNKVKDIPGVIVTRPVQSNAVFAKIPREWVKLIREKYFFYVWDEQSFECRWMTAWDTSIEDVDGFAQLLQQVSKGPSNNNCSF